jgi:hypothetical protein
MYRFWWIYISKREKNLYFQCSNHLFYIEDNLTTCKFRSGGDSVLKTVNLTALNAIKSYLNITKRKGQYNKGLYTLIKPCANTKEQILHTFHAAKRPTTLLRHAMCLRQFA